MASIRYYNQTAPFWDFVANLEHQGADHPFFASRRRDNNNEGESSGEENNTWGGPWGGPWGGWGGAHRGWHRGPPPHGPHHHHRGPPGPPQAPPAYPEGENPAVPEGEKSNEKQPEDPSTSIPADGPSGPREGRPHPRCGGRHGGRGFRGRGGHCGRGAGGSPGFFPMMGMGGPFLSQLGTLFQTDNENTEGNAKANEAEDFRPEADVFDTEAAYIVHVSLPGAKKEDVAVSWDAEKSELTVSGVVHRPGDEELLKTLALDERRVGAFERKVRLGSRANPAQVDVDEIRARMEEGILRIEVPKLDKDYVEIKKVDIE